MKTVNKSSNNVNTCCVSFRSKRNWFLFRRSERTGSNTCWSARSGRSTPSTWRACAWASATWAPWTFPRTTTDEEGRGWESPDVHLPRNTPPVLRADPAWRRWFSPKLTVTQTPPEPALAFLGQSDRVSGRLGSPHTPTQTFSPLLWRHDKIRKCL